VGHIDKQLFRLYKGGAKSKEYQKDLPAAMQRVSIMLFIQNLLCLHFSQYNYDYDASLRPVNASVKATISHILFFEF
jgi:hypothetical protein